MPDSTITVLGECVADAFTRHDAAGAPLVLDVHPGGGPANTAVALARLGTPTRFLGRISTDAFGELFRQRLTTSGVDVTGCIEAPEPSTLAIAGLDGEGQAVYSFYAEGTADWQWTGQELEAASEPTGACVHTGSLALARDPGGPRIEEFLERSRAHATVCIDPNVRPRSVPPTVYRGKILRWCALADIIRLSEDDLAHLAPDQSQAPVFDRWHAAGARLIVLTRGAHGAVASLDGRRVIIPGIPVEVVDTVGAGDAFTAGLLHHLDANGHLGGRLQSLAVEDLDAACAFAVRVAAATCAVRGAQPPWAYELDDSAVAAPAVRRPRGAT
jgi:fructokinase